MQYIIIAQDGTDDQALQRRMNARPSHLDYSDNTGIPNGEQLMGAAILNDRNEMCGSVMIVEFENRAKLDEWLEKEAYVTGNVWQDIQIIPCKVGPSFLKSDI